MILLKTDLKIFVDGTIVSKNIGFFWDEGVSSLPCGPAPPWPVPSTKISIYIVYLDVVKSISDNYGYKFGN